MPLKPLPFREVARRLKKFGFVEASQRGGHKKFVKQTALGTYTAIVPNHREIAAGTIRSILRQANVSVEEWDEL